MIEPYQQPSVRPTVTALPLHVKPFTVPWTSSITSKATMMSLRDLSDHYPILSTFKFELIGPSISLDGCSNDMDCHLHEFHCLCTGPFCYFNGKHINGLDLSPKHPVNRNCLYIKTEIECVCGPT